MRLALGACPPLFVIKHPRVRIRDVLSPLSEVPPAAWVEGRLVHRARTAAPPTGAHIVADLHIDAASPIRRGSHVRHSGDGGGVFTVRALDAEAPMAPLFYDVRGKEYTLGDVPVEELAHVHQKIPLLSVDAAATAFTKFGLGIARNRKQLWLRNGRAYEPQDKEVIRLHELFDVVADTYDDVNRGRGALSSGEAAGTGISMRMAEAQAARASLRQRRLGNCRAAQRALDGASTCQFHRACVSRLATIEPWPSVGTYIVFPRRPRRSPPLALVGADLVSLPLLERRHAVKGGRASAVATAGAFVAYALPDPPVVVLACDDPDARIVACPMLTSSGDDGGAESGECDWLSWRPLAELASGPLYDFVAAALAHTGTFMHHGAAAIAVNARRGARPLRPFARAAVPPALHPGAWPAQLQYAEAVGARFRAVLSRPRSVPSLVWAPRVAISYLREWADRVDPSHTADMPDGLRGRPPDFSDARLLELPCAFVDGGLNYTSLHTERAFLLFDAPGGGMGIGVLFWRRDLLIFRA